MKETFGEYIHKLRVDNGLTLTKLAAALDIDQSTLSKIENGKRNIVYFQVVFVTFPVFPVFPVFFWTTLEKEMSFSFFLKLNFII